jgi:hypothetical protein
MATEAKSFRAFGWVQDPSDFRSLCNVVAVFDFNSVKHKELINSILPKLVLKTDGLDNLLTAMNTRPLKIKYNHLVGTAFKPRSNSRCNGIIQATVKGQVRDFICDWPADNFVRWAHCLGFIKYDYTDDTFTITQTGLELTAVFENTENLSENEQKILTNALLSYPPAMRVLTLLSGENAHLTKFEIGRNLGFIGEGGFGSMPQSTLIRALSQITDAKEKNKIKTDWEGASDKYARMISGWLINLGLAQKIKKTVSVLTGGVTYSETIGQAYMITAQGYTALNRALGKSSHTQIKKNICFEMLATKGTDREYLRTRRALIIKQLSENRQPVSIEEIFDYLNTRNVKTTHKAIQDDIAGLGRLGLDIVNVDGDKYLCKDKINDFIIPLVYNITESEIGHKKDKIRESIKHIPKDYLSLLDLAYDKEQNRLFEMKTLELLTEECGYMGTHLGGSRKPDGIIYTAALQDNYGVIIDTKAYSNGYSLPISQADEMQRYIQENQRRDKKENPNKWWDNFSDDIERFYFMFISGHFKGKYQEQIDRISNITGTKGAAVPIDKLLLLADSIKGRVCSLIDAEKIFV